MAAAGTHYPWYKKEDTDAFFALFQNNIANFVIIAITMLGMGFPTSIVYGQVLPGAAVAVMVGNFYYAWSAARLARKENRSDVTALSYGISTPRHVRLPVWRSIACQTAHRRCRTGLESSGCRVLHQRRDRSGD